MKKILSILLAAAIIVCQPVLANMQVSNGGVSPFTSTDTLTVYATGTAYTFTGSSAALDFGTTDPSLTITKPGTYLIIARVNVENNAATFASNRTVTLKLRRTNNTAADLTNGSTAYGTGVITTLSSVSQIAALPRVIYTTTNSNDAITVFGDVSVLPSAGSLQATECEIIAIRLY